MADSSTQVVIVGGSDFLDVSAAGLSEQTENPLLMVDGKYEASIPFLLEYFKNGKNAEEAYKKMNNNRNYIPLAVVFLKQFIEKELGLKSETIYTFNEAVKPEFVRWVKGAKLLLISTTLMVQWKFVETIAQTAKQVNPNITIVAGGMAVFKALRAKQKLIAEELTKEGAGTLAFMCPLFLQPFNSAIDFCVCSIAGEHTLIKLLGCLSKGSDDWKTMQNIAYFEKATNDFHINELIEEKPSDVEVDWSKVPIPSKSWVPVQVGQGCPFHCGFCDFGGVAPKVTRCDKDAIFRTISSIPLEDGVRRVQFTNDNLLLNKKIAVDFLSSLIQQDLKVKWKGYIRADSVQDEEVADLMAKSGCEYVLIGVESAEQSVLNNMNKVCKVPMIPKAVSLLIDRGILVRCTFVIGFPGETKETIQSSASVMNSIPINGPLEIKPFALIVMPLADVSTPTQRQKHGLIGFARKWKHNTMSFPEAQKWAYGFVNMLKPEISPSYEGEVDLDDLIDVPSDVRRKVFHLRQLVINNLLYSFLTAISCDSVKKVCQYLMLEQMLSFGLN